MSGSQFDYALNHFELFGLAPEFELDMQALEEAYRGLQARYHPDRHASGDARDQREALQAATRLNEAYRTLRDPRLRAGYLLGMAGIEFDAERDTLQDPDFLMRQLELREAQEEAAQADDPIAALEGLHLRLRRERDAMIAAFAAHYAQGAFDTAKADVLRLSFYDRLCEQLDEQLATLEDAALD
ncbi:Fe-S protein assembly co-chaperone HscB [Acidihalobacter ferrooxydans]|uniref:Co-chaperone protein HscB homolog n=1 Tax=Acidihalobacter ferrooxydans TaxID=1765967 RepID=A0A1P8UH01_9GAMM|nr:Fe-S protein assembly co-chaperone HscB [Acidihalobacter ferrooxydans]APZ43061.1 Fe-S protein assembly co-chaperone HscB [Acidihalobacter ferrooxydans]